MRTQFLSLIALLAFAPQVFAAGPRALARDSWSGPISPGSVVRVHNPYGDIRLRHGGSDNNLEVAAILQQLSIDGSKLVLEVEITDDTAEVTVVRYDIAGNPAPDVPRGDDARAELAVLVPEGATTRAETTSGLLEARGVRTDIDLHTAGGTIRVAKNRGRITAHSERGAMEITLETGVTKDTQVLSSITGPITVFTSSTNDLDVTMTTSGAFITDFSLAVEHYDHEEPNKVATTVLGRGGVSLKMTSKRGDLGLRRVVTVDTD
jgi:hypothetical protein